MNTIRTFNCIPKDGNTNEVFNFLFLEILLWFHSATEQLTTKIPADNE